MTQRGGILVIVVLCLGPAAQTQVSELNLSTDLTRLGIASQNMVPDQRDLDSRPLFGAALDYVKSRRVPRVTLNPGSYYFLTPVPGVGRYSNATELQDVTFDFGGAHLYLRDPYRVGLWFVGFSRVTFQRFTVDYLELPFTQVRVTDVRAADRVVSYELVPGFRNPTDFNLVRTQSGLAPPIYAVVYRDGQLLENTGRMSPAVPLEPGSIRLTESGAFASSDVVRTFRPGDTLVIFARGGGQPLACERCTQVTIRDVEIHAAADVGLVLGDAKSVVVERVRVIPRPGTDRLISTNADGIQLTNARSDNLVRHCEVRGTGDDGVAVNSEVMAFVDASDAMSVTAQANWKALPLQMGGTVSLVSAANGTVVSTARITNVDPPNLREWYRGVVRLTFDRAIPSVPKDSAVVMANAADRGEGTIVEDNFIADAFMARGIYVAGVAGVTVRNNTIVRMPGTGILIDHDLVPRQFSTGPAERIDIIGNRIEDAVRPNRDSHTGSQNAFGGVQVIAKLIPPGGPVSARSNSQIRIMGNIITGSGRSGIWAANVDGLTIQDNTIERSGLFASSAPIYGWPASDFAQLRSEFAKDIAVRNSDNVTGARTKN